MSVVFLLTDSAFLTWSRMATRMRSLRVQRKSYAIFYSPNVNKLDNLNAIQGSQLIRFRVIKLGSLSVPLTVRVVSASYVALFQLKQVPHLSLCVQKTNVCSTQTLSKNMRIFSPKRKSGEPSSSSTPISNQMMHERNVTSVLSPRFCAVNFERKLDSKQARSGPWCALFPWLSRLLFDSDGSTYYCRHCRHIPRSKRSTIPDLSCIVPSCENSTTEDESEQPWCSAGQLEVCILRIWHLT